MKLKIEVSITCDSCTHKLVKLAHIKVELPDHAKFSGKLHLDSLQTVIREHFERVHLS